MWAGHTRPAGSWFTTPAAHEPPVCTDTVIDVMSAGDPPEGGARRGHAYLGNGFELCELMSAQHSRVGHRTTITVSVQTGGSCAAGVVNHEPAGRA